MSLKPTKPMMRPTVETLGSSRSNHTRTHSAVMEDNASDKIASYRVKKLVRKMQKQNHREQKCLTEKQIMFLLRKSTVKENPGMPAIVVDALVLKKIDRVAGAHRGSGVLQTRSPTAQDYLKTGRQRVTSSMAKYRR